MASRTATALSPPTRRELLAGAAACSVSASLTPSAAAEPTVLNDASGLNPTTVAAHWVAQPDLQAAYLARLRRELKDATVSRRPVAIGAARHSMGGQSLAPHGTAITLDQGICEVDRAGRTYRIMGGTRWRDVLTSLDPVGLSPKVMQSNHDFGVAASFSVNAHGWPAPQGPCGSTVRAIDLMLADGTVVSCSRKENEELFRLAMGGYGLFGVVVAVELEAVANLALTPAFETMRAESLGERFAEHVRRRDGLNMGLGRLSVAREHFCREAELVTFRPATDQTGPLPPLTSEGLLLAAAGRLYRAQIGSDLMKRVRWQAEIGLAPKLWPSRVTRNRLLNTPVSALAGRDLDRTDILHEYFVPPESFGAFCKACREVIPPSRQELLNVTLRYVAEDPESLLAYAPTPRIGAVMAFSQRKRPQDEAQMRRMTEGLIDSVLALGGTYYLPYRLHARPDQLGAAYPKFAPFCRLKRHYDPGLLFRNGLWNRYAV